MQSIRLLALPALAALLTSCPSNTNQDTDPYGVPDSGHADLLQNPNAPYGADPTYDTPAAYEDAGGTPSPADLIPADHGMASAPASGPSHGGRGATTHVVASGDSLSRIARQYGVSVAAIKEANQMTNDIVVLGRTLRIPAGGAAPRAQTSAHQGGRNTHTVAAGDTLGRIAAKYGVSSASIKQANGMTNDTVVLGRKLIIPSR